MRSKILVIVDSIDPDSSSGAKANVALIKNLKHAGFNVLVYHYSRKDIKINDIDCVSIKENKFSILFVLSRLQRVFTRITKININPKIESLFGFSFTFFNDVRSIKKVLMKVPFSKFDKLLTLSYASSFRPHRAVLKSSKWHNKWLAYIHDPYPMHSYPRPYDWVEPGHKFKRRFFLDMVEKSMKMIYPSGLLAEWMESYYHHQKGKEIIIPHQIANYEIDNEDLPHFFDIDKFNLLHAGNMMSARNPIALIEAFCLFLEENPQAKNRSSLMFVGNTSVFDDYIKDKKKNTPELFLSEGIMPHDEVLTMQHFASVNVILEVLGPVSPFLPGKFPHCVQANKPILLLGPYYSECKRLLGDNYLFWSEIDNVDNIKSCIEMLYKDWLKNKGSVRLNRKDLEEYMSPQFLKKQLLN